MENAEKHTFADLSRFVRRSPRLASYVIPVILFLTLDFLAFRDAFALFLYFLAPLVLIVSIDHVFVRIAKFHFPSRRINFLDFVSFFIIETYFLLFHLIVPWIAIPTAVAISLCPVALMRAMIFYVYFSERAERLVLPSVMYSLAALVFILPFNFSYLLIADSIGCALIFAFGGIMFAYYSMRKFRKEFGLNPIRILNFFLNLHSTDTQDLGDKFFSGLYGRKRKVPVKVVRIEDSKGKTKVLLIFPYVHPGPFGNIGTSNLPYKLHTRTLDLAEEMMVFHTSTTNSNNSASESDVDKLATGVRQAQSNLKYHAQASRIRKVRSGKISVSLLRIGDFGIGALIPEKERFDDVSLTEGLKITEKLKDVGASDFAVIDAQNHFSHGASALEDCEIQSKTLEREFRRNEPKYPLRIGYSRINASSPGLGPMGVQCIVFELGDKNQAIVLTDSNNIKDEVMELATEKVATKVAYMDIFTTDNHFVNQSTLDMNPLGERDDKELIANLIDEAVQKALDDVEDCRAGMGSSDVEVSMGEEEMFQKLLTNVFRSLKSAKYAIFFILAITVLSSYMIFGVIR